MEAQIQTVYNEIGVGFRLEAIHEENDDFYESIVDYGPFETMLDTMKHYALLQNEGGWSHAANIYAGKEGILSLPLPALSCIIENDRIFDCFGNEKSFSDLGSAQFIIICKKTGKSL